jgi:hypothetical protein
MSSTTYQAEAIKRLCLSEIASVNGGQGGSSSTPPVSNPTTSTSGGTTTLTCPAGTTPTVMMHSDESVEGGKGIALVVCLKN